MALRHVASTLTLEQAAECLNISLSTADRGWRFPMVSHQGASFSADMDYKTADGRDMPGVSAFRKLDDGNADWNSNRARNYRSSLRYVHRYCRKHSLEGPRERHQRKPDHDFVRTGSGADGTLLEFHGRNCT